MKLKSIMVSVALVLIPVLSWGDSIQTDRPDFVESSNTVLKGFQIETSIGVTSDKQNNITTTEQSTPTLLRYGVSDNLELRLETSGLMRQTTDDPANPPATTESGSADYAIGIKWHQKDGDEKTGAPSIGWLFHLDMPGGTGVFKSDRVRPSIRVVAEWELPDDFSLGIMPGVIYDVNTNNERFYGTIFGAVLGKSFNDKFRGFVEFAGEEFRNESNGGSSISLNTGVAYLLTNDVQVDMALSRGLNQYTPAYAIGFGLSMRFK